LLQFGFEKINLNRIEAEINPNQYRLGKVLEKLGFIKERYFYEIWIIDGKKSDSVFYGLIRSKWNNL
jgi:[ribosomal protein S5]-alanine N-acetyltransferase